MNTLTIPAPDSSHSHVFLGAGHEANERRTWAVIVLCSVMMVLEIGGGSFFGSLAVVADGLHMSTHVLAILIVARIVTYDRCDLFYSCGLHDGCVGRHGNRDCGHCDLRRGGFCRVCHRSSHNRHCGVTYWWCAWSRVRR